MGIWRRLGHVARLFGIDAHATASSLKGLRHFRRNRREFLAQNQRSDVSFPEGKLYPCLTDRYASGGTAVGAYFHQDLLVAQLVFRNRPARHVDVGSRVDGFVAHVASFCPIEVIDIRPLRSSAQNISFRQQDMMAERFDLADYTDSLSCLHALEHFGLGRYGDPVRADGHMLGWRNLHKMLRRGGKFYFAVPIGEHQRVEFDAHRVFSVPYIVEKMIEGLYGLESFHYVDDPGELHRDADPRSAEARRSFGTTYGCGIFELTKL
ncbi:MAG TPA: DUF268 domain-containing protein [Phycisphaerales bacterium]|nr:DUF268 domain-containing protein [Phycisphaerales bacterium]